MRIALAGTRGIPANYGGFETFAEELSTRLAARGHQVTVYCRERYPQAEYRGVRRQYLPTIRHKYFDTLAHTLLSTLHLVTRGADPGWTPLFGKIGGLVMESGGQLSHGSVVAREYGIPAVVGIPDATRVLHDGDLVLVDGEGGTVLRLRSGD